jgi:hypothetical protein
MSSQAAAVVRSHHAPNANRVRNWFSVVSVDHIVCGAIVLFGFAGFLLYQHSSDFLGEDVFYADCARSLLAHGFYGIAGRSETNQPPGLSGLLAILFSVVGYGTAVCLRAIVVLEALGFIAAYQVLKQRLPSLVAAAVCILLISSPIYFQLSTQMICASMPFLFTTMATILVFRKYEGVSTAHSKFAWGAVLAALIVASLMFASAAIALLGAIVASLIATFVQGKQLGLARARKILPVLLVGIAVQAWWMHRKPAPLEWPLPGYPAPYLQQLKVKSGNYPELGIATASDVMVRIKSNLLSQSDLLAQIVLRHGVNETKVAVVIVPVLLIALGWAYSLWQARGQGMLEWYFAGYEFIYLLWPWGLERRFFLPIAPLACLYAWEGIKAAYVLIVTRPRLVGIVWSPIGLVLGISGCHWLYTHRTTHGFGLLPDELLIPTLLISSVGAAWMAYKGLPPAAFDQSSQKAKWLGRPLSPFGASPWQVAQYGSAALMVMLFAIGVSSDVSIAKENVETPNSQFMTDTNVNPMASEIQAGLWIRSHTPPDSVVMARHLPLVFHYAQRKMVWFAPTSNPDVLMSGVDRHHVDYVIVIKHKIRYYLPDDDDCFDKLLAMHPEAFQIVRQEPELRIFEVVHHHHQG